MPTIISNKSQLVKKNIFLDATIWSIASNKAKVKNISVAQEIRNQLAQVYLQTIEEQDSIFIKERANQRRNLAGSLESEADSDKDGAINHNDIYSNY